MQFACHNLFIYSKIKQWSQSSRTQILIILTKVQLSFLSVNCDDTTRSFGNYHHLHPNSAFLNAEYSQTVQAMSLTEILYTSHPMIASHFPHSKVSLLIILSKHNYTIVKIVNKYLCSGWNETACILHTISELQILVSHVKIVCLVTHYHLEKFVLYYMFFLFSVCW